MLHFFYTLFNSLATHFARLRGACAAELAERARLLRQALAD